jgi:hypothetical protein
MARIAGVDIPNDAVGGPQRIWHRATRAANTGPGKDRGERGVRDLTDDEVNRVREVIDRECVVEGDLRREVRQNVQPDRDQLSRYRASPFLARPAHVTNAHQERRPPHGGRQEAGHRQEIREDNVCGRKAKTRAEGGAEVRPQGRPTSVHLQQHAHHPDRPQGNAVSWQRRRPASRAARARRTLPRWPRNTPSHRPGNGWSTSSSKGPAAAEPPFAPSRAGLATSASRRYRYRTTGRPPEATPHLRR